MNLISKIYQSSKTIFTNNDLAIIWQITNPANLNAKISYYVKKKELIRLSRGIYAKKEGYSAKDLATSIYLPSYISFETVLRENGLIFQHYDRIFVASKWTKSTTMKKNIFCFRKLKELVLYNPMGILYKDNYSIATPERAFLDMIYLFPNFHFDNLSNLNWEKCQEIAKIYQNKQLIKRLNYYQKNYAK